MAGEKPTAAMVLSILAGLLVLGGGVAQIVVGSFISSFGSASGAANATGVGTVFGILGIVGIVFGIIMIVGGVMMYTNPRSHTMWGVIVLILSIISWGTSFGGLVLGFILGLIGGILGIVFKPSMTPGMMPGQQMGSMPMGSMGSVGPMGAGQPMGGQMGTTCKNCGASIPAGATRCPSCGASVM